MKTPGMAGRHGSLRSLLLWSGASLSLLWLSRLSFLLLLCSTSWQTAAALTVERWLQGLRFDLATLPLLLALPSLRSAAALGGAARRFRRALDAAQATLFFTCGLLLAASNYNYVYNQKHLGWELFAYLPDALSLGRSALSHDPWLWPLVALLLLTALLLFRLADDPADSTRPIKARRRTALFFLLIVLLLSAVLWRGGFQQNPLRPADAILGSDRCLDQAKLNGIFTVAHDMDDRDEFSAVFPEKENRLQIQALFENGDPWISEDYPLLRRMGPRPRQHHDIILIVMESFSAALLVENGAALQLTPGLQSLIAHGRYFSRTAAAGGRSANGLTAMLLGIPDRAGRTLLRSNQIYNRFGALPRLLRHRGYRTLFFHGGDLRFDNLDRALPHWGFDVSYGREQLKERWPDRLHDPQGYYDEDLFDLAFAEAEASAGPAFLTIFTLSTHHPFVIPPDAPRPFPPSLSRADFYNSVRYSDAALLHFVQRLQSSARFRNAAIVITADHCHHHGLDYLQDRMIPLLLLGPEFSAGRNPRLSSQLDVGPTILALAGGNSVYAMLGDDLTRPTGSEHGVFFAGGSDTNAIGWIEGDWMAVGWLQSERRLLLTARPPANWGDRSSELPEVSALYLERARRLQQFVRGLEARNRLWPPQDPW
ncbi:MAG: LTA synthase family protein [Leptospirales bacterium]|nr:LTA synthase family protein [Leptospirales bacterium]